MLNAYEALEHTLHTVDTQEVLIAIIVIPLWYQN